MIKLKAPEGATTLSIGGVEIAIVNGVIEVEEAVAEELRAHGFVQVKREKRSSQKSTRDGE